MIIFLMRRKPYIYWIEAEPNAAMIHKKYRTESDSLNCGAAMGRKITLYTLNCFERRHDKHRSQTEEKQEE